MAFKILNRVKMTVASSPGTGSITLGSALQNYQSMAAAGIADGDTVPYVIEDLSLPGWEIGTGTYTASGTVLARTTVLMSSAGGTTKISATSNAIVMVSPSQADLQSTNTLTSGTLSVARGGTGATTLTGVLKGNGTSAFTAATAGTDYLAPAAIGTTVQAWDGDLAAIAALAGTSGLLKKTAANTWSLDTTSYLSGSVSLTTGVTGTLPVANGGTNASSAGITAFNNITGYTASGATGTTSTNIVFSTSPTITTPTITGYTETAPAAANSGTATTISISSGTVLRYTMTGNCTFTMPAATTAGQSFIVILTQDGTGGRTAVFTSVKWPSGTAPTITTTATTGRDILTFVYDGTNWYGTAAQAFA